MVRGNQASEACRMTTDSKVALEHMRKLGGVSGHQGLSSPHLVLLCGWKTPFPTDTSCLSSYCPCFHPSLPSVLPLQFSLLIFRVSWAQGRQLVPCLKPGGPGSSCLKMCCGYLHRHNAAPGLALQAPCREKSCPVGLNLRCQKLINELCFTGI